ncbi:MAG: ATP synthase subunit J [delta proteobacterium ML8_F1]|nr:MAG: ATP synthase subunit J [delta proteobacterium ML8_F1]
MKGSPLDEKPMNPAQILVLGFSTIIFLGMVFLNLPIATASLKSPGLTDALFTATSAVCVTGLVVADTGTYWSPFGQGVILLLIQIGGIGFMSMATFWALLIGRKIGLKNRMIMQEAFNQSSLSGIVRLVKYVLILTLVVEGIGALLLSGFFIPLYGVGKGILFSIFHSVSAYCNAGFDLIGGFRSFTPFVGSPYLNFVILTLLILGGLGFSVVVELLGLPKSHRISFHSKVVLSVTGLLLGLGFIVILALEYHNPATLGDLNFGQKILAAFFQSATPRTAGFNTVDTGGLRDATKFFVIMLMFIGGSPGSTAGGIKTTTLAIILLSVKTIVMGQRDTVIFKKRIRSEAMSRAFVIFTVSLMLVMLMVLLIGLVSPEHEFLDVLFETVSAFGTVGLSAGITPELSTIGKLLVVLTMFAGRVGPLTLVVALAHRRKRIEPIRFPEDKISVG